jgi:hypothetical protein
MSKEKMKIEEEQTALELLQKVYRDPMVPAANKDARSH